MPPRIGLDTNILLCFAHRNHPEHASITAILHRLRDSDSEFCFTPQNIGEFWNVSTRPVHRNGFGVSPQIAWNLLQFIEQRMTLLPDNLQVYTLWQHLLIDHQVRGVQVHDAHLAASLEAHGVTHLLTFNTSDFKRFPYPTLLHPEEF